MILASLVCEWRSGALIGFLVPVTLANAGILKGKRATAYPSVESYLRWKGAMYTGKSVEIAGNIVTAKGPEAAKEFARTVVSWSVQKQWNVRLEQMAADEAGHARELRRLLKSLGCLQDVCTDSSQTSIQYHEISQQPEISLR